MATILSFERHPVHPDAAEDYTRLLDELVSEVRGQPGVLWADAARAFDDEPSYVVVSEWRTSADLDAWEQTDTFRAYRDRSDPLVREDPTRRRFAGRD